MNEYDKQIAYLTKNPERINDEWMSSRSLFKFVGGGDSPLRILEGGETKRQMGCLTMIRKSPELCAAFIGKEPHEELTRQIAVDERIPKDVGSITVDDLPVFKEWQERVDEMIINYEKTSS